MRWIGVFAEQFSKLLKAAHANTALTAIGVVVAFFAVVISWLEFSSLQVQERESRIRQYIQDIRYIQESRSRFNGWATSEASIWRAKRFMRDYPDEVSPLDYLSLITSTRFAFSNPDYLHWARQADSLITEDEFGPIAAATAKHYHSHALIRKAGSLEEISAAEEKALDAIAVLDDEIGMDVHSHRMTIISETANALHHAGYLDQCESWLLRLDSSLITHSAKNSPDWLIKQINDATTDCVAHGSGEVVRSLWPSPQPTQVSSDQSASNPQ